MAVTVQEARVVGQQVTVTQSLAWAREGKGREVVVAIASGSAVLDLDDFIAALVAMREAWSGRTGGRVVVQ